MATALPTTIPAVDKRVCAQDLSDASLALYNARQTAGILQTLLDHLTPAPASAFRRALDGEHYILNEYDREQLSFAAAQILNHVEEAEAEVERQRERMLEPLAA